MSEPILLGLLLVPSWGGLALSFAAFDIFLLRQPPKNYLKDVRNKCRVPRTITAQHVCDRCRGWMLSYCCCWQCYLS
ncbi:MAG: hypothetical protein IT320_11680 [Anaerolineae bacterium]|nr:hypothetical protein [Anaerolineae bacterium]